MNWAGYQRLRKGRIHIWCVRCHRKFSNAFKGKYDPPSAELVHTFCERCGNGGKEAYEVFLNGRGKQISWTAIERHLTKVAAREGKGKVFETARCIVVRKPPARRVESLVISTSG